MEGGCGKKVASGGGREGGIKEWEVGREMGESRRYQPWEKERKEERSIRIILIEIRNCQLCIVANRYTQSSLDHLKYLSHLESNEKKRKQNINKNPRASPAPPQP
jgi:hypothetical protein